MIHLQNVEFSYPRDSFALAVDDLKIPAGEHAAVIGPSGCGKTTLLRLIAGILPSDQGAINVLSQSVCEMSQNQLQQFRIENIGLVFQEFELLDYLNARENILLPYRVSSALSVKETAEGRCDELAESAGITALLDRHPSEMSQGERQRVSICRALVTSPKVILADEPTGNLDPDNQQKAVELLKAEANKCDATLVMVTHEHNLLPNFERVINVGEGI